MHSSGRALEVCKQSKARAAGQKIYEIELKWAASGHEKFGIHARLYLCPRGSNSKQGWAWTDLSFVKVVLVVVQNLERMKADLRKLKSCYIVGNKVIELLSPNCLTLTILEATNTIYRETVKRIGNCVQGQDKVGRKGNFLFSSSFSWKGEFLTSLSLAFSSQHVNLLLANLMLLCSLPVLFPLHLHSHSISINSQSVLNIEVSELSEMMYMTAKVFHHECKRWVKYLKFSCIYFAKITRGKETRHCSQNQP